MSSHSWLGGVLCFFAAFLTPAVQAADKEAIDRSIARGVVFLKQTQTPDGSWTHNHAAGATALAALALLESGVPADDPAIRRAADYLRRSSLTQTHTYSLALANLFFDRLNDPVDVALIESITVRLLAGQSSFGGWTYLCPQIAESEVRRLSAHLTRKDELPKVAPKRTPNDLPKEIRDQVARIAVRPIGPAFPGGLIQDQALLNRDDNSNTQFAILGLWVSRKHGLPVDVALARADRHFRRTQHNDGGWGYLSDGRGGGTGSTPAMTCAGLLGLAMGHGATGEAVLRTTAAKPGGTAPGKAAGRNLATDRAVGAGLALLATAVGHPRGKVGNLRLEAFDPPIKAPLDYYYLWSLERVAMIYGLNTIGKKDWYAWGAERIVEHQHATGGWVGSYATGGADTSFALLFLSRSNLAQDLTAALRGKLRDPGEVQLRAGGFPKDAAKAGPSETSASPPPTTGAVPPPPRNDTAAAAPKPVPGPAVPASGQNEAQRLTEALVRAPAPRQDTVLAELVESKGPLYTEALAAAIPQLTGETREKARDGLVKRLARMTAATLRDKFKDDHVEVRRAAALAVELKGDRQLIPDLIALLTDPERSVTRAAQAALKEMTRQDFGPPAQATAAERNQAVARWKEWWAKQK